MNKWMLVVAMAAWGCDDGSSGPDDSEGAGGAAGEGGAGPQPPTETCDQSTRCATEGAVCRLGKGLKWGCFLNEVPVGEECETDEDCGGNSRVADCARDEEGGPKVCAIYCAWDVNCPEGMACDGYLCVPEGAE